MPQWRITSLYGASPSNVEHCAYMTEPLVHSRRSNKTTDPTPPTRLWVAIALNHTARHRTSGVAVPRKTVLRDCQCDRLHSRCQSQPPGASWAVPILGGEGSHQYGKWERKRPWNEALWWNYFPHTNTRNVPLGQLGCMSAT